MKLKMAMAMAIALAMKHEDETLFLSEMVCVVVTSFPETKNENSSPYQLATLAEVSQLDHQQN